eukprot:m.10535 g.10535  ORF g.10535 m.10535 type:complete len:51 (-) comp6079_c0_seq1:37-189(-)
MQTLVVVKMELAMLCILEMEINRQLEDIMFLSSSHRYLTRVVFAFLLTAS